MVQTYLNDLKQGQNYTGRCGNNSKLGSGNVQVVNIPTVTRKSHHRIVLTQSCVNDNWFYTVINEKFYCLKFFGTKFMSQFDLNAPYKNTNVVVLSRPIHKKKKILYRNKPCLY